MDRGGETTAHRARNRARWAGRVRARVARASAARTHATSRAAWAALPLAAALLPAPAAGQGRPTELAPIEIIANAPVSTTGQGGGVDRDKVPAMTQTLTAED